MIGIIKYNGGNTSSVTNALDRLNASWIITDKVEILNSCEKIILPGVGAAGKAMESLRANALDQWIKKTNKPFLGICLGMQLLCEELQENNTKGLGIIRTKVSLFPSPLRVPQIGWNNLIECSKRFEQYKSRDFYFVHSYYVPVIAETIAVGNYGSPFSAAIQKNNFIGVQFHPEKSSKIGLQFIKNFIES